MAEIRRDPHINEDQKKTLIRIYEASPRERPMVRRPKLKGSRAHPVAFQPRAQRGRPLAAHLTAGPAGRRRQGGMNVYVRELVSSLAQAGVRRPSTPAGGTTPACVVDSSPGFEWCTCRQAPAESSEGATARSLRRVHRGRARRPPPGDDVMHPREYGCPGIAGHSLKHELDIPLVSTFHTLARGRRRRDAEPQRRIDASSA